jgi:6,7-dimethyl-8-ribityllumazine synthase
VSGLFDHERLGEVEEVHDVPAVPLPERVPRVPPVDADRATRVQPSVPMEPSPVETNDLPLTPPAIPPEAPEEPDEHAGGTFRVPGGYSTIEGAPDGESCSVGVVVSRFNSEITSAMLDEALAELDRAGVSRSSVTVMPVPGAFELPLGAMALAKTRRFACIVALGCVIRGETAHFEYVAGEAASGLQLAAIETGVPVAFGVLTTENREQAEARVPRAADAVRSALEMADLFSQLRTPASGSG